ncbi:hypothetical protein ACXAUS_003018 [Clostridium sporogenes]|uniref:Uncharacterized protein n=1 Tax=Clostridium sporogenes TaxID=1509 RepID=A0A1L3NGD5_CLOSG|nr:hypothetical protein [Clostridium sporogenes]MDU1421490.1 hypothetical protein [Clostridium botulinum]APH15200.1 hypothetical protein NPD5_896 [Clostridium sporogenes]MBU5298987.1 hypothetical protein [Clostridium sporogenes]MDU6335289.1 hypothetical protein [Clostridium sporogenes]NFQ87132.1 hypothetical protein [Clostridium sporogenes]
MKDGSSAKARAKELLLEGKSKEYIMDETRLRLKDIKRIEREITEKL